MKEKKKSAKKCLIPVRSFVPLLKKRHTSEIIVFALRLSLKKKKTYLIIIETEF